MVLEHKLKELFIWSLKSLAEEVVVVVNFNNKKLINKVDFSLNHHPIDSLKWLNGGLNKVHYFSIDYIFLNLKKEHVCLRLIEFGRHLKLGAVAWNTLWAELEARDYHIVSIAHPAWQRKYFENIVDIIFEVVKILSLLENNIVYPFRFLECLIYIYVCKLRVRIIRSWLHYRQHLSRPNSVRSQLPLKGDSVAHISRQELVTGGWV